jgi:hypothetical protein
MLKLLFNSASVMIIGIFLHFALTSPAFATIPPEAMKLIISTANMVNELGAPITLQLKAPVTLQDKINVIIEVVLEPAGPGRVLMKGKGGDIILSLELSGPRWIAWDAEGNRYEDERTEHSDSFLPANEAKSVRVGNENLLELAILKEDKIRSYKVFIATPTTDRERLHEIAKHYMNKFEINPDQEGDKRRGSLEIFFYRTTDAFPREQFNKLLKTDEGGNVAFVFSSNAMGLAKERCSAIYYLPSFGKGRVTDLRWRRLKVTYSNNTGLKGSLIGIGLNQSGTHLLIALSDGRILIDLADRKQLLEKGSGKNTDSYDNSDSSTGWYQAGTRTAYGFGKCEGQKFNIIGPGVPIGEKLLQETKIEDMLIGPDDFMLGTKNKDILIIGHLDRIDRQAEYFELLFRRHDVP